MARWVRHIVMVMALLFAVLQGWSTNDYVTLQGKAQRFFQYKEWASASAMYELMLAQRPKDIPVYCSAIVAAGMMKNEAMQASLLERSELQAVPFDSLFNGVMKIAVGLGEPSIYVDFMSLMKVKQPWLTRTIDVRLLDFYAFRSDADNMISTANVLLKSTPDNIKFLSIKGEGYSLKGEYDEAMDCYRKVLEYDPSNLTALLILGNYYNLLVDREFDSIKMDVSKFTSKNETAVFIMPSLIQNSIRDNAFVALSYLEKAVAIKSTPFLLATTSRLKVILSKLQK